MLTTQKLLDTKFGQTRFGTWLLDPTYEAVEYHALNGSVSLIPVYEVSILEFEEE